jgi:hypothetical protein
MFFVVVLATTLTGTVASRSATPAPSSAGTRVTSPAALAALVARTGVPSFSRQTKLACSVCHNGFPQLTAFGRQFKLNGYTMTGLPSITAQKDSASRMQLSLPPIGPLSLMTIASVTSVSKALPNAQALTAQFPQQLSLFASGAISDKMGIFSQFTYEDQSGKFSIDNVDIRYANHTTIGERDVLYGVTLHNNPTVQDLWNTTPAWGYPFNSAAVAPTPAAATLIDGGLGQSVVGLGAYSLFDSHVYAELTGYVSAPQEVALPLDSNATNTLRTISPYWRLGLQHQFAADYLMVGTFGMHSEIYPTGITGPTNKFTDNGVDAQLEHKIGDGVLIGRATFIHESQTLTAGFAAQEAQNLNNSLNTYKFNVSYIPNTTHTITVGYFGSSGSTDNVLYAPGAVTGSSDANPVSQGEIFELAVNPYLNVRLGAQYVLYQKFNGASNSYDLTSGGRNASDNNTLHLYLWFAY